MLDADSVIFFCDEGVKLRDDFPKMFIGAFDPFTSASERMTHGKN